MGVFWPLDRPSHMLRLAGLLGVVVGWCALFDRDTRYAVLRKLYTYLRQLDEEAAAQIEENDVSGISARDKKRLERLIRHAGVGNNTTNARDTRSFASDSTVFSRVGSPQHHAPESPTYSVSHADSDEITQPSSAQCNTPEAVTQLGEALSRLQLQQASRADKLASVSYTPSPLSQVATGMSEPRDANWNSEVVQHGAVASDEMLLPLTADNGPHTPQPDLVPKAIDASKRLAPLPNPSAPKIKPTMLDGQPQPCEYTPPTDKQAPAVIRRERGHVEIETTDHESYGFVSNPSALMPMLPGAVGKDAAAVLANNAAAGGGDHYLFVCVKCHRQSSNDVCEKICSDEDGVLRCKLRPSSSQLVEDLEDLVMPMTPKMYMDGRRKTTGRMLYENLQALHAQHERMKERAACRGSAPHSHADALGSRECPNAVKSRLRIVPVNCLSMCHLGNVIAVSAPGKFGYQFGAMHENDSEDMQAILQFAEDYIENQEGFTKNKTRPARLSRNILARIPPPLPTFTSIAE